MEHQALTNQQVQAMDETMTHGTHRVIQMHRRTELEDHFAPGVIEGGKEPISRLEKIAVALIYLASVSIVFTLIGWGYEVLSSN